MKPTKFPCGPASAHDALYDQIERQLRALTSAPLDAHDSTPRRCVDEFANDFLACFGLPTRRRWPDPG